MIVTNISILVCYYLGDYVYWTMVLRRPKQIPLHKQNHSSSHNIQLLSVPYFQLIDLKDTWLVYTLLKRGRALHKNKTI